MGEDQEGPRRPEWDAMRFRHLSRRILLCAGENKSSHEFLIDVARLLASHSACDALEMWVRDKGTCVRWEMTCRPERFSRLGDLSVSILDDLSDAGPRWTNDLAGSVELQEEPWPIDQAEGLVDQSYQSLARFPLMVGKECSGLVLLKARPTNQFKNAEIELYRNIASMLAVSVEHHRVQHAQRERVKELTCLYRIAQVAAQADLTTADILERIVEYLLPGWQYPDITAARIVLDGREFKCGDFAHVRHRQAAPIILEGEQRGLVEVCYTADRPDLDEGPFLVEERNLIDAIAHEVANISQRKQAEGERIRLQQQLTHADRLATIGQLAAGVAHELNEPLLSILGFVQLAQKHPDLDRPLLSDLSRIETASLHAREIVRKLMLFARQTPPGHERIDLNQVTREALSLLESRCLQSDVVLVLSLHPQPIATIADPSQIRQVVINLVVNAIQAMPTGGTLTVATHKDTSSACLTVADTGSGMPADVAARVFEPFYTTKDVGEGTGLGLSVVHGIVTAHGGRVHVNSEVGDGTQFEVRLPMQGS